MDITIIDYNGKKRTIELGPIEDISVAFIKVLSGDEVLTVVKKDGTYEEYDSSSCRTIDFFDDKYTVIKNGEFLMMDSDSWINRTDSYWYIWGDKDEEGV